MPACSPSLGKLREDCEFKASLGCRVGPCIKQKRVTLNFQSVFLVWVVCGNLGLGRITVSTCRGRGSEAESWHGFSAAAQPPSVGPSVLGLFSLHGLVWVSSSKESQVYDRKEEALPGDVTLCGMLSGIVSANCPRARHS